MSRLWWSALMEISMAHRAQHGPSIWRNCCEFGVHGACVLLPLLYCRLPLADMILPRAGALSRAQWGVLTGIVGGEVRGYENVVAPGGASVHGWGRRIMRRAQ